MTATRLLSSSEVAERLGIARQTVPQWVATGKLTAAGKLGGRSGAYVFDADAIDALATARAESLAAEAARLTSEATR